MQDLANKLKDVLVSERRFSVSNVDVDDATPAIVVGNPDHPDKLEYLFHPNVVDMSDDTMVLDEACPDTKGLIVKIKRPVTIRLRYRDENDSTTTTKYTGMTARLILQQYDRINGVSLRERANLYHWNMAMKKLKQYNRRVK